MGGLGTHQGGIEFDQHGNARIIGARDEIEGNLGDAPDGDAAEFDGGFVRQSPNRLVEKQQELERGVESRAPGRVLITVELE